MKQTTSKVFMVRPVCFGYNPETAVDNTFQQESGADVNVQEKALNEFDGYVALLRANNVDVVVVEDTYDPKTPDSIFPNNWFSTHEDGTLVLYPMAAQNRRAERKKTALDAIKGGFDVRRVLDMTPWETEGFFLEGTGVMILDRPNKVVYASESPRCSRTVLEEFCGRMGYTPVVFNAVNRGGVPIYHTNVLMTLGTDFAVLCKESIRDAAQLDAVVGSLEASGRKIVDITYDQLENFAGNMLELCSKDGHKLLVMSLSARNSLTSGQLDVLTAGGRLILSPDLRFIEKNGGGSARCMLAEIF